ncbi:ABC transporter ATP-binding protein [Candidatus Sumerlaeota bacterium]|nr:ABC transporter ATP-binding protein [Candidatus Sumerlaeota bacterium]
MSNNYYHEEEILGKAYDARLMKRLLRYVKPYRHLMFLGIAASLIVSGFELALPYIVKSTIDGPIANSDFRGMFIMSLVYLGLLTGSFLMDYIKIYILNLLGQKAMRDLRMQIFEHVETLSLKFFDKNPVGRLMTRITNDVQVLNEMFASGVVAVAGDVFLLIGIITLMIALNWKLSLLVFATLPLLFGVAHNFRTRIREIYRDIRSRLARLNSYMQENLSGMRTIQVYNRESRNYETFRELNAQLRKGTLDAIFQYAVFFPGVQLTSALGVGILIWYGGGAVIRNVMTIGALILFIQYVTRFFQPIRELSEKYNILQSSMASSERIFKILDTKPLITDPREPESAPRLSHSIEFRNVWFAYDKEEYVLHDVSFTVPKGQSVAIVGATGAGKTSLINLLCRFYDYNKGAITIDGIELRRFRIQELRSIIGLVLQDVFLFYGDVAGNIRLGRDNLTDDDIEKACRTVNAHDFISAFPDGYQQKVRERGATLSQGQKQLLAFARALAFDPKLLILDEATSSIDTATEVLIQDALKKLLSHRTSIIIAHRLSTIRNADKIIVMHKGKARETGSHQELIEKNGLYRRLYELQYRHMEGM